MIISMRSQKRARKIEYFVFGRMIGHFRAGVVHQSCPLGDGQVQPSITNVKVSSA